MSHKVINVSKDEEVARKRVQFREDSRLLNNELSTILAENSARAEEQDAKIAKYIALKERLKTLSDKMEYEALVPLSKVALVPGKIRHTNEILFHTGDDYYIECSAKTAINFVDHRIEKLEKLKSQLAGEAEMYDMWKLITGAYSGVKQGDDGDTIEIMEDYDEEQEKAWRVQHRESLLRHRHQLKDKKEEQISQDEEKMWERLDELELQEELENWSQNQQDASVAGPSTSVKSILKKSVNKPQVDDEKIKANKTKANAKAVTVESPRVETKCNYDKGNSEPETSRTEIVVGVSDVIVERDAKPRSRRSKIDDSNMPTSLFKLKQLPRKQWDS